MSWPVTRCKLVKKVVTKHTPSTKCTRNPVTLCGPRACAVEAGDVVCRKKLRTIVHQVPEESCRLEPRRVCNTVTKLLPRLEEKEECVQVPREVCTRLRNNPRKEKKPVVKQWCFVANTLNRTNKKETNISKRTEGATPFVNQSTPIHPTLPPTSAQSAPQFPPYKSPNSEELFQPST